MKQLGDQKNMQLFVQNWLFLAKMSKNRPQTHVFSHFQNADIFHIFTFSLFLYVFVAHKNHNMFLTPIGSPPEI
jgi:hypothetical protein